MKITQIVAMVLAGILGVLPVISGSMVLLGLKEVGYVVLNWLVIYNIALGIFSIFTAFLIWKYFTLSKKIIALILCSHSAILTYLYFFNESVALESIKAMLFRVVVWLLIFFLANRIKFTKSNTIQTKKS